MWNLVDPFSANNDPAKRRAFYPPLASLAPDVTASAAVTPDAFQPKDLPPVAGSKVNQTVDLPFAVTIPAPQGGFVADGDLPDPRIRLHAVHGGLLSFCPPTADRADPTDCPESTTTQLKVTTFLFATPDITNPANSGPAWFDRWIEADCIPRDFVYEGVDTDTLRELVDALPAPEKVDPAAPPAAKFGVSFPLGVTTANRKKFTDDFMAGATNRFLVVVPGAYVGVAAPVDDNLPDGARQIIFHTSYANGNPMSPREYLHLLFGDDSAESSNHPLLLSIDAAGKAQTVQPETKSMRLRPPLRTHARVLWEADLEILLHHQAWAADTTVAARGLGPDRYFSSGPDALTVKRDVNRPFRLSPFTNDYKCNVFVGEMAIRSGFKFPVGDVGPASKPGPTFGFLDANSLSNFTHVLSLDASTSDRQPIVSSKDEADIGAVGTKRRTWGYRLFNQVRSQPDAQRRIFLNDLMDLEGRCLLFSGSRCRKFRNYSLKGPDGKPLHDSNGKEIKGIADCALAIGRGIGHVVIIEKFTGKPVIDNLNQVNHDPNGPKLPAFHDIPIATREARGGEGAARRPVANFQFNPNGGANANDALANFMWLEVIELAPGGDPQTRQGLRSLFVFEGFANTFEQSRRGLTRLAIESAPTNGRINKNADGTAYTGPKRCCKDSWPTADTATEVTTGC